VILGTSSPDVTKDPLFEPPKTYEEMIARAEAEMTSEERAGRYAPSSYRPHLKPIDY
jgi:hypothetical protein